MLLVSGSCAHGAADKAADGSAAQALTPVFQADMPRSLERLAALPDRALPDRQRRTRDCIVARIDVRVTLLGDFASLGWAP